MNVYVWPAATDNASFWIGCVLPLQNVNVKNAIVSRNTANAIIQVKDVQLRVNVSNVRTWSS